MIKVLKYAYFFFCCFFRKIKYFHIIWAVYYFAWTLVLMIYLFFGSTIPAINTHIQIPLLYSLFDIYFGIPLPFSLSLQRADLLLDIPTIYIIISAVVILGLELRILFLKAPFSVMGRENK